MRHIKYRYIDVVLPPDGHSMWLDQSAYKGCAQDMFNPNKEPMVLVKGLFSYLVDRHDDIFHSNSRGELGDQIDSGPLADAILTDLRRDLAWNSPFE